MSSVLIFLAFMGIAALIKRHEAAAKNGSDTVSAPTNEEQEDIERRIREIFGLPAESNASTEATTSAKPMASRVEAPQISREIPPVKITPSAKPKRQTNRSTTQGKQGNSGSFMAKKTQTATQSAPTSSPAKSEIESIIEDFSLERAVIYSEILEPKFKEY